MSRRFAVLGLLLVLVGTIYNWLNWRQGVAKLARYQRTKGEAFVKYDIFAVR